MPASAGRLGGMERKRRFLAAHEEHVFADAGADAVDGHERPAHAAGRRRPSGCTSSSGMPVERRVLAGGDDVADDATDLHGG